MSGNSFDSTRRNYLKLLGAAAGLTAAGTGVSGSALAANGDGNVDPNDPGILEPVLTELRDKPVRIPNTDQADDDGERLPLVGDIQRQDPDKDGVTSLTGHDITQVTNPHDDIEVAIENLTDAADDGDTTAMETAAQEIYDILHGDTEGRIYDGFPLLNYSQGGKTDDQIDGEYKMKRLRDTGKTTETVLADKKASVWEVDVNLLWFGDHFVSDTFLLRVPAEAKWYDELQINYRTYSLVREDFAPTVVTQDKETSVQLPFKGYPPVWVPIGTEEVVDMTVKQAPLGMLRGIYNWGWREHPPRIDFIQPIHEAKPGKLNPKGKSFAVRNRNLTVDGIGDAAPEKKLHNVATAVLDGAAPDDVLATLNESDTGPRGTYDEWLDLAADLQQLPPEATDKLGDNGVDDYRFVSVYLNNEMYGMGPEGATDIEEWEQGDVFDVKVINLDDHTHYYRNVDFGPRLHDDIADNYTAGRHSFEIFNFKPTYGAPKVAEMQWRAGWGFRPHFDVIQQPDVFPRASDRQQLQSFTDGAGDEHDGYLFTGETTGDHWRFNPPKFIIGENRENPSQHRLMDDGEPGLRVGKRTDGYGVAKMPKGDLSDVHPKGLTNVDADGDGEKELAFPPFLRNPDPEGGDIIPPTPVWAPFLFLNPNDGTLKNGDGYWVDETYIHGAPVEANDDITATIENPRTAGMVFYQFDPLFHDTAIFSPHPDNGDLVE